MIAQPDPHNQYGYWTDQRLPEVSFRNCGVNRQRVDEIAERYAARSKGADAVVIQGGINDIAQGGELETIIRGIEKIVERAQDEGKQVVLVEILPWNNGGEEEADKIETSNRLLASFASQEGVPLAPWYTLLEDEDNPRRMQADLTIDGDHR